MKVKICGLRHKENIQEILELKPNFIGFIFYKESKRYAGEILDPEFIWSLPAEIKKVGVFVNEPILSIIEHIAKYNLDYVQLHGNETVEECKQLNKLVPVIKAFQINESFDFSILNEYEGKCHYFLFDSLSEGFGGSGKQFNHELLREYTLSTPYFISGGIGIDDINNVKNTRAFAVDINSKFEIEPGLKSIVKLSEMMEKIKVS